MENNWLLFIPASSHTGAEMCIDSLSKYSASADGKSKSYIVTTLTVIETS